MPAWEEGNGGGLGIFARTERTRSQTLVGAARGGARGSPHWAPRRSSGSARTGDLPGGGGGGSGGRFRRVPATERPRDGPSPRTRACARSWGLENAAGGVWGPLPPAAGRKEEERAGHARLGRAAALASRSGTEGAEGPRWGAAWSPRPTGWPPRPPGAARRRCGRCCRRGRRPMRPTVTVGPRFRWVSKSAAGGRVANGFEGPGLPKGRYQVAFRLPVRCDILESFPMKSAVDADSS